MCGLAAAVIEEPYFDINYAKIEETFSRRKLIYQRSCSMIKKLITLNKKGLTNEWCRKVIITYQGMVEFLYPIMIASIEELKEFHLLLHNLTLSKNRIIDKLKSYEESSLQLGPAKETFDHNMFALNQGRFS